MTLAFDALPSRDAELRAWLYEQWTTLEDGQTRLVFPPGEALFAGLRREGDTLWVNPGGLRPSMLVRCADGDARIVSALEC